jgi:hypothetical protein
MFARVAVVALLALLALSTVSVSSASSVDGWGADASWAQELDSTPLMKELELRHSEFLMALGDSSSTGPAGNETTNGTSSSSSSTGPAQVRGGSAAFHGARSAQSVLVLARLLTFTSCASFCVPWFFPLLADLR